MEAVRRRCGPTAAAFALCVLVGALAFLPRRVRSDTGVGDRAYRAQPTRASASAARRVPFYDELERRGGEASVRVYAQPLDSARLGRHVDAPLEQTRLLPELFLLGGVKCASTFMFECINSGIFDVNSACGPDVSKWKDCVPKDGKRYIVTSLKQAKEPFGYTDMQFAQGDIRRYAGPDVPLELMRYHDPGSFMREGEFLDKQCKPKAGAVPGGCLAGLCRLSEPSGGPLSPRADNMTVLKRWTHPGCTVRMAGPQGKKAPSVQLMHHYPWREDLSEAAVAAEGTPNYLMSKHVAERVAKYKAGRESNLRFIVLLRDPVDRAYSEYSMFRTWGWEKEPNVTAALLKRRDALATCTGGLVFGNRQSAFDDISIEELRSIHERCFDGKATRYFENGLYYIGLKVWMSYFDPSQFLVMTFDEVTNAEPEELLGRIADFANLHLPDKTTAASQVYWGRAMNKCQIRKGRKIPQHQTTGHITDSDEAMLRELFKPWNDRLERLLPNVPINWA